MPQPHLYVARTLTPAVMAELDDLGLPVVAGEEAPPARDRLLAGIAGAAAAIVTLTERVDAELLDAAGPQLRVVANVAVGYDNIDLEAAAERGVVVCNTPGVLDDATADHTFAMLLATTRRVVEADRFARTGRPWIWGPNMLVGLDISADATLGIVGFGRIGRAVARRAHAFGMRVITSDPGLNVGDAVDGVTVVGFEELLATADVVSLHVPLLPSTRHLIDASALARMRPRSYLVNAARGGVVDESALIDALRSGHLAGAALDTFEGEPRINPEFAGLENVVLQPHIASAGDRTRDAMCRLAVRNVTRVLAGEPAETPVRTPVATA
ncbi:MAG: D-glycerate dehydrogenase [Propionicimonas sp.]|uniref:2-hydroxyacid dehydrogenase n=1 Tax=Propionicimonas sp. TaxID=1955623 RepID=UPI003D0F75E8